MRKEPTEKQKRFAREFIKTGNITQSAKKHYQTKKNQVAYQIGSRNLQNPTVKSYIEKVLKKYGLGDEELSNYLQKIILASTSRRSLKKVSPSDGLRGIEMSFRLKDRFPAEKRQITKQELQLKLEGKSIQELSTILGQQVTEAKRWLKLIGATKDKAEEAVIVNDEGG